MKKTILELDLVGYSTICATLEQGLDVSSASQFNKQIQNFVNEGLKVIGLSRAHVATTTGDGAILLFDSATEAYQFAVAIHTSTLAHNDKRSQALAKRVFRIGIATGDVDIEAKPEGGFDIAGTTIARAVRLEAQAAPGGLLVDEDTFAALQQTEKEVFGPPLIIRGKRDEVFKVYATQPNPNGPQDASFFVKQAQKSPPSPVLKLWQEKLEFLQGQEAIITDSEQKFALKKRIEEVEAKIIEHGGRE